MFKQLLALATATIFSINTALAQTAEGGVSNMNELATRSNSLKVQILGPENGLYSNMADILRPSSFAMVLDNLHMLKQGVWSVRDTGWTRHRTGSFNSGAPILAFCSHTNNAAPPVSKFLLQSGAKLYVYDLGTQTETLLATASSATAVPCLLSYSGAGMFYMNGVDAFSLWDGTSGSLTSLSAALSGATIGSYTGWGKPTFGERFLNRFALARFGALTFGAGANIQYQAVLLSGDNAGVSWPVTTPAAATDAGYIAFATKYGTIRSLQTLRLRDSGNTEVLLVGMDKSLGVITGTSALDFKGSIISTEFGVPSNNTWAKVGEDMYFLATDGIRRLRSAAGDAGGFSPELVSQPIQDVINRINSSAAATSWSMYNPKTQELVFWVPVDNDTSPTKGIVLNFQKDRDKPVFSTISQQKLTAGIYVDGVAYGGTSDGYLEKLWQGNDYDGTAIQWDFVSAVAKTNSPAQNASSRKFTILTEGSNQVYTAEAYTLTQRADEVTQFKQQDTKAISITKPSITKLGTWASGSTTSYAQFTDFQPMGSGRYWVCRLKGTNSGDYIDLVGVLFIEQLGGFKQ